MIFDSIRAREFALKTKKKYFKYSTAGNIYSRVFRNHSVEIFPGIFSFDPTFLNFSSELAMLLHDEFTVDVLPNGFFAKSAVSTNFMELNTVAGYKMTPIGYAMIGNDDLRKSLHLSDGFVKTRHEKIFKELMSCYFGHFDDETQGKIARISSSGFPAFTSDLSFKHGHLDILSQNMEDLLNNITNGRLDENYEVYGWSACSVFNVRSQYDGVKMLNNNKLVSKERLVNDLDYALSGGKIGNRFAADKSVIIEGSSYHGKFASRIREVNAKSSGYNNLGTAVFEGFRSGAEKAYAPTWKHRTREEILKKLNNFDYTLGLDVTTFDQSFPLWLCEAIIDEIPITDGMKDYCRIGLVAPSFYSANSDVHDPVWTGDPSDINYYNQFKGLPSGIFYTSAFGKLGFTFAVLCAIDDIMGDVIGNVDKILKHKHHDYGLLNMGDDTVLCSNRQGLIEALRTRIESTDYGMSEYFKVDVEEGLRFLGNVGYIDSKGQKNLCGDLATYFGNMLVPERSIGSRMREYGVYGLLERREVYSDNPSFSRADEIFQKTFRKHFGTNWLDLLNDHMILPASKNINVRSPEDLEVLLDPSKLFYKYTEDDVSDSVLSVVESKMSRVVTDRIKKIALK